MSTAHPSQPASDATRVRADVAPPSVPDPVTGAASGHGRALRGGPGESGSRSYLDFRVSSPVSGVRSLAIHHEHLGHLPLPLGLSVDGARFRTVVYPGAEADRPLRTTTIRLWMPAGASVIRLGEGRPGAEIRISGIDLLPVRRAG